MDDLPQRWAAELRPIKYAPTGQRERRRTAGVVEVSTVGVRPQSRALYALRLAVLELSEMPRQERAAACCCALLCAVCRVLCY